MPLHSSRHHTDSSSFNLAAACRERRARRTQVCPRSRDHVRASRCLTSPRARWEGGCRERGGKEREQQ
eukprot:2002588-Rhodomonas_salina.2